MMYNFKSLINLYKSDDLYLLQESDGYYDNWNNWVEGEKEYVKLFGAVTNLKTDELKFDEGGAYNHDDRKLYCYMKLEKGTKIKHKGKIYTILEDMDYSEHEVNGLHIYYMKRGDRD